MKRFLIKHVGNMGDMVFFIPPVLETLKKRYPDCHITFITAWGFKDRYGRWGKRNQSGFCINLIMTNPHIDQLVHWHDIKLSLEGDICIEDGQRFPTWNRAYYEKQKNSGDYDGVYELDLGLTIEENPIERMYKELGINDETYSNYKIYLTEKDLAIARQVMENAPKPRIVFLEGLDGATTRGWDPAKVYKFGAQIKKVYGVKPIWFGAKYSPNFEGRELTLRENIATLTYCDAAVGVLSGALHFAAAVSVPTITLFCDSAMRRFVPAYFLNEYISDPKKKHRTVLGPTGAVCTALKADSVPPELTADEKEKQNYKGWLIPGRQATKSCMSVITPEEVMAALNDIVSPNK